LNSKTYNLIKKLKKSLGQHLLTRPEVAEKIVTFLTFNGYEHLLEVGPGQGVLTKHLIHFPNKLVAVEFDRDMVEILETKFSDNDFDLIQGDFLHINLHPFFDGLPFALVGNFPYNISSQIVFKMLEYRLRIPELVGMFQKEMAARIIAPHGSKTYGVISVLTQAYYSGESMMILKPGSFTPPPKVDSMVIRLTRREELPNIEYKLLRRVVKAAFGQRRKKLSNALKGTIPNEVLTKLGFSDLRAEQLSVEDFLKLAEYLEA
jgi:16S rRNA (adenine1518-N6/adenine1519-N6)-dimethyltransferase